MNDAAIILTKNNILQKVSQLLQSVQNEMVEIVNSDLDLKNAEVFTIHPKISKGENYEGLPYLILDYPRAFDHQNIFVVRSMFWWGNFFSSTIQLSGKYKSLFKERIVSNYNQLSSQNFFIGINKDPWIHHFNPNNYKPIKEINEEDFEKIYDEIPQIKIAAKCPLSLWTGAANIFLENWMLFINLTKDQLLPKR